MVAPGHDPRRTPYAIGFFERLGDLGYAVLRVRGCQMTPGAINVSSKFKKELRTMHRDDVGRSCNIFQLGVERLHFSGIDL